MLPIHAILHPTDFSSQAQAAFGVAQALARDHGATLILLHVAAPLVSFEGIVLPAPENTPEQLRAALEQLQPVDPKVQVAHLLAKGDPAVEILRVAKEQQVGLIVMGTHGWTGLVRLLMGSVAEQVVRKAPCPVLTVRMPMALMQAQASPACAEPSLGIS